MRSMEKILEVNVDDLYSGGVFSLVKNVIINKPHSLQMDIATFEKFEKKENINLLSQYNCNVFYVGYDGNKYIKQLAIYIHLKKLLITENYDYVHIHSDVANKLLISGLAARRAKVKKIIFHSHASGIDGSNRGLKMFLHEMCRPFLKFIGTDFVACSDVAANWMFPNIPINKIILINNGIDLKEFRYNPLKRANERARLGLEESNLLIGHIGRFAYQKNHEYLISIFSEIIKYNPKARLLLVGTGPNKNKIVKMVNEKALQDYVIFYGTTKRVNDLLQAMDVFVLPSHFEGLPIVGVEAQAAGLPVIFSDQITHEAKLIDSTEFLPITTDSIELWYKKINELSHFPRTDTYALLKQHHFDIQDTIMSFLKLYY